MFDGVEEISLLGLKADSEALVDGREVFDSRFETFSNALVVLWKNPIFGLISGCYLNLLVCYFLN